MMKHHQPEWKAAYAGCKSKQLIHKISWLTEYRICFKRKTIYDGGRDILSMTVDDLAAMNLHPATLQYSTRTTTESRFWSKDKSQLSKAFFNAIYRSI
jgi:thiamine monophosphate kinase